MTLKSKKRNYYFIVFLILNCILSCKNENTKTNTASNSSSEKINTNEPFTTNANELSYNNNLLKKWDAAHNAKNLVLLSSFYANQVFFYTKSISIIKLINEKKIAFNKNPDYMQNSVFVEDFIYNDRVELYFDKTFTISGKSKTIRSILILARIDSSKDEFKIIEESDVPSKKYLKKIDKIISNEVDFNGDGKTEYAEIIAPKIIEEEMNCENGDCITEIKFSDNSIKNIEINNCIGGMLELEGDLNNDGAEEIGILDDWFTSRWGRYIVYTNKNSTWQVLTTLSVDRFTVMDDAKLRSSLVRKIGKNKVEISNYIWNDEQADMIIKKSIITIP